MRALIIRDMSVKPAVLATRRLIAVLAFLVVACSSACNDPSPTPIPTSTPALAPTLVVIERPPHPDIAAAMTAVAEDNLKPRFTGQLNGFTFIGMGTPVPRTGNCTNADLRALPPDGASDAILGSDLNFEVTDLPPDLMLVREHATVCGNDAVTASRVYEGDNARLLSVVRVKAAPIIESAWARDSLTPMNLGGRDAVVIRASPFDSFVVYLRDEESLWVVSADPFEFNEIVTITNGLR
jgi:hypothetical protein